MATKRLTTEERFWAKVDKAGPIVRSELGPCWLWTAARLEGGYGIFDSTRTQTAHRFSYEFSTGPIAKGMMVLHRCDVRACVRPDHLFLGTGRDNMQDCSTKGRIERGEERHNARFTADLIRSIRADHAAGMTQVAIGAKYGVRQGHVSDIVLRKAWKHVF